MRRLILLRHTKSDWPAGLADHDRPLNPRGRRAAALMGELLVARGYIPDRVLVSTAKRTEETWALARAGHPELIAGTPEPWIYEALPRVLDYLVARMPDSVQTLLLVGHNPGIEDFALDLASEGHEAGRRRMSLKYPTGGLAVIDCAIDHWSDLASGSGRLIDFVVPRDLDREAE
ncbi:histidine phosphatase family protein [Phreatobacter aquaticus]|uniref:Histidine phosphatase family protein n=2 Tax=Phreatobacter aquaticus TaxID=2570229 RepID=A0A4D7QNF0_9HYPH|nr:histidine phosphatase family protein [Phreatobacter aquaticus]